MISFIVSVDSSFEMTNNFFEHFLKDSFALDSEIIVITDAISNIKIITYLNSLKKKYGQIRLIKETKKSGYGKVNNIAVSYAKGKYLFFINVDVFAQKRCFDNMLSCLEIQKVDCVQPLLIWPQNNLVQCAGTTFGPYFKNHLFAGNKIDAEIVNIPGERQALTSALYAMKKETFDSYGGFDEFYFNKLESFELSYKIFLNKGKLYYLPSAKAYHSQGAARNQYYFDFYQQSAYFWTRFGHDVMLNYDLHNYLNSQIKDEFRDRIFHGISFSHIRSWPDILKKVNLKFRDYSEFPWFDPKKLNLYDILPNYIHKLNIPIAFMVENIRNLENNKIWFETRQQNDLVLDTYGNLVEAKNL